MSDDGRAPTPREQGWLRVVLALAAFLSLSHAPVLRAVLPVADTFVLLVPALAACCLVGWWLGGRALLAVTWVALTVGLLVVPSRSGAGYHDLARGWALLAAGAFGVVCVMGTQRPFLARALAALGIAVLLAYFYMSWASMSPRDAQRVFAAEFASRNASTAAALQQWVGSVSAVLPAAGEWAASKTIAVQRASAAVAAPLYPSLLALESLGACALAWSLYHRLSRARLGPPLAPLRELRFNDQLIWGLVVGITFAALPAFSSIAPVGVNLVVFFAALYALRGLGILARMLPARSVGAQLGWGVAGLVLAPVTAPVALGLGVTDTWFDWRRRVRAESSAADSGRSPR